jgi:PAS domain S-box-containing protein
MVAAIALLVLQASVIVGLLMQRERRRTADEQVRQNERRYRLATDAAHVGVWEWNPATDEIYVDRQLKRMLGYEDHELGNKADGWRDLVHPDDREAVEMFGRMHLSGALPVFELEHRMMHKDGSVRWFLAHGAISEWKGAEPVKMIGTSTDITQHKADQQALLASEARAHALVGKLMSAQETERRRIARELHDDASQQVALLSIGLAMILRQLDGASPQLRGELKRLQDQTTRLGDQIRHFSHALHPSVLQRGGLIAALREHCTEVGEQHGLYVDFHASEVEAISSETALCLYRIAQETFHNIGKHAHATRVEVELKRAGEEIELTIADDGLGFDSAKLAMAGGLGLISLDERVRYFNGTLSIEANVNRGTRVRVRLPEGGGHDAASSSAARG